MPPVTSRGVGFGICILAGGLSTRVGMDKALLEVNGAPLYRRAIDTFSPLTDELFFQLRSDQDTIRETIGPLANINEDHLEAGPLGGLISALVHTRHGHLMCIAVDMPHVCPLLHDHFIRTLEQHPDALSMTIRGPEGHVETLCGVYSKELLPHIDSLMKEFHDEGPLPSSSRRDVDPVDRIEGVQYPGIHRVLSTHPEQHRIHYLDMHDFLQRHGLDGSYFANINTLDDLTARCP